MRKENYTIYLTVGLVLTLAILLTFQIYIFQEPDRIAAVEAHDQSVAFTAGQALFKKDCTLCHGDNGEGTDGRPSLNDKPFLTNTSGDTIFSIISSGVPNTEMPAWSQSHGGPLTDEDVRNLVAFIRAWEPNAPDRRATPPVGNLTRGKSLYANICAVCHGKSGEGAKGIVALNDPTKLKQFDDAWYRDVIVKGRPAQGMPTWGTVLSPTQITDLLTLLDSWRQSASAATPAPTAAATAEATTEAPTAVATAVATESVTGSPTATAEATTAATVEATAEATEGAVEVARPSNPGGPGPAIDLVGDPKAGGPIFVDNCQKCHGQQGQGGVQNPGSEDGTIPPLNPIDETLIDKDPRVYATNLDLFIEHGSKPAGDNPKEVMAAWGDEKKLTPQQIADVIAYVMSLNPAPAAATPAATATATEVH